MICRAWAGSSENETKIHNTTEGEGWGLQASEDSGVQKSSEIRLRLILGTYLGQIK